MVTIKCNLLASHIIGGTISYEYIGTNQYVVNLTLYRDCGGISGSNSQNICFSSASNNFSANMQLIINGPGVELPHPSFLPAYISTCQGGPGFGVEQIRYSGVLVLPYASNDWILSYTADLIVAFPQLDTPNFLVTTRIDNINFPINSSIQFSGYPEFLFCVGIVNIETFHTSDQDGDSIVYEITPTMADSFFCPPQPVTPTAGSWLFLPTSGMTWFMHPTNGWLQFQPLMIQVGFITIKVSEYRGGFLVNETILSHNANVVGGCSFSGIPEIDRSVKLYPNPVGDVLNIETSLPGIPNTVSFTTPDGKSSQIHVEPIGIQGHYQINMSRLVPGIYLVSFPWEHGMVNEKIVRY